MILLVSWLISILNRFETQIEPHDKSKIFGIAPRPFELRVGVGVSAPLQLHVATSDQLLPFIHNNEINRSS